MKWLLLIKYILKHRPCPSYTSHQLKGFEELYEKTNLENRKPNKNEFLQLSNQFGMPENKCRVRNQFILK